MLLANICSRSYLTTAPWNTQVLFPIDPPNDFPTIQIPSEEYICRKKRAIIEGKKGNFYGCVCKKTKKPEGYGVFVTD